MNTSAMIAALQADGPDPDLAPHLGLFGRFVGSWDVEVVNIAPDGSEKRMEAEWHFGWALQGRAIMDVWIAPRRSLQRPGELYEYGATLRFYDPAIQAWRSTWIGPVRRLVRPFVARQVGGEIVLEGSAAPNLELRWIFSEVTADSFRWRNQESEDGGRTWRVVQRMAAARARG